MMRNGRRKDWSVYILCCADGSLYTGVAKNAAARIKRHNAGKGAAYTRMRRPVRLVYREVGLTQTAALKREVEIKAMPRPRKARLIERWGVVLPKLARKSLHA